MPANYTYILVDGVRIHPGTKMWRKYFKGLLVKLGTLINRTRTPVEKAKYDNFNSSKRDRVEYKILTHFYHCDTKNAILQVSIFKKLCQETSASVLGKELKMYIFKQGPNGVQTEFVEGDEAYKYQMEHMGRQINNMENWCRALITYDVQNSIKTTT